MNPLRIWDLHPLDLAIVVAFLIAVLAVGVRVSRSVKHESDFYVGGRRMGRALQFFLNFGNATDSNAAPTMAGQVYAQGVSGMWLQLQTLFITPFFWFTQPWFRRARVITMADLFLDRFDSKPVASAYALFNIMVALLTLGLGNLAGYSVVDSMLVKPYAHLSVEQKGVVDAYRDLQSLQNREPGSLTLAEKEHLRALAEREKSGELRESFGILSKAQFYLGYNLIVAFYIMLGGLKAAALTDAVQGLLILFMSIILIPIGLHHVGGFSGLHARVPATSFWLSGTSYSNFTWYSIAAVTLGSLVQIIGLQHNMASGGSARDENTARFGMITGGFTKRLVLICWMLCGLLAVAVFSGPEKLAKPDLAWGALSSKLLPVGLTGLMLSGMLLGHMPAVGMTSVSVSGLVVKNVYQFIVPGKSEKHYLRAGQLMIFVVLFASVLIAYNASGLGSLTTLMITFNTFFGAAIFLLFFWRRLTVPAILGGFTLWIVLQVAVPVTVALSPLRSNDALLIETHGHVPVFFEDAIVLKDVEHPGQGRVGLGRFLVEDAIVYWPLRAVGVRMEDFSRADLYTARWLFDAIFPFLALGCLSMVTRRSDGARAERFFAKMKTPVAPTPELDRVAVEENQANPQRVEHFKLFPGSNWEFTRWSASDFAGFFGCWAIVGAIVLLLFAVLRIGT